MEYIVLRITIQVRFNLGLEVDLIWDKGSIYYSLTLTYVYVPEFSSSLVVSQLNKYFPLFETIIISVF